MTKRRVSLVCGYGTLVCFLAAVMIYNSDERYSWDLLGGILLLGSVVLPVPAALTGSKMWLLAWLLPLGWLVVVLLNLRFSF